MSKAVVNNELDPLTSYLWYRHLRVVTTGIPDEGVHEALLEMGYAVYCSLPEYDDRMREISPGPHPGDVLVTEATVRTAPIVYRGMLICKPFDSIERLYRMGSRHSRNLR